MRTKMIYLMMLLTSLSIFSCTRDSVDDDTELSIQFANTGDDEKDPDKRDEGE